MSSDTSTKPYLIRALHEWCSDNGYTPYVVVAVRDNYTQVPDEYVNNNEIVLNIAFDATKNLLLKNDYISFCARFGGISREIIIPVGAVLSIFAKETGEGMGFEYEESSTSFSHQVDSVIKLGQNDGKLSVVPGNGDTSEDNTDPDKRPPPASRPKLTVVK